MERSSRRAESESRRRARGLWVEQRETWPASERRRMSLLTLALQLSFVNAADFVDRGDLIDGLVVAQMGDAREAERVAGFVARRLLDAVECDLENDRRRGGQHGTVASGRCGLKVLGETRDLGVGEAGVGLADVDQLIIAADCEG